MAPAGAAGRHSSRPQSLCSLPTSQSMLKQQKAVASVTPGVYQIRTAFCRLHQSHMSVDKMEARSHVGASPGDSPAIPKPKRRDPVAKDIVFLSNVSILWNQRRQSSLKEKKKHVQRYAAENCLLFTSHFCFIVTLAATFLSSVTV